MDFETVAGKTVQRANIDPDDLTEVDAAFRGEFDFDSVHIEKGAQVDTSGEGAIVRSLVGPVDLSGSRLAPVDLSDVRFAGAVLANTELTDTTARRVEFTRCQGIGLRVVFTMAADLIAEDCRFDFASMRFDKIKNAAVFRRCSFREATFGGDLSNIVFDDCDLVDVEFAAIRAVGCDFTSSRLVGGNGLSTLRGARIDPVQAGTLGVQFAREAGLTVD
ncbi:pentapeptide repeat-containing protein [Saccharothrix violaceirubra]|uniref:Uncharacterized protein YjbI with pentapeptide repeats n=1 Tax=Saccharothrix violaceirubra TaxID=413306 RepID=A0A7W7T424_9PSEU|nr:pentapeptide repeat-containing protein [Saccharothrix violaceirubra]MBB4966194.1 uncharacterized protein YjbI with pentapeptide repeats [Saccharothrix violaceirubra]